MSKFTISPSSIYKHDAIDITDLSSMQDACHMNFVIDLAHRIRALNPKVWGSIPYGDSRIFCLSHARDTLFLSFSQNLPSLLFLST